MPIAHLNYGQLQAEPDSPQIAPFMEAVEHVNALAEAAPGFLWRMLPEAMEQQPSGAPIDQPRMIATISTWADTNSLYRFTYGGDHGAMFKRRGEWFEKPEGPSHVIWTIPDGHTPTVKEGLEKLHQLASNGPSADCFDLPWWAREHGAA